MQLSHSLDDIQDTKETVDSGKIIPVSDKWNCLIFLQLIDKNYHKIFYRKKMKLHLK